MTLAREVPNDFPAIFRNPLAFIVEVYGNSRNVPNDFSRHFSEILGLYRRCLWKLPNDFPALFDGPRTLSLNSMLSAVFFLWSTITNDPYPTSSEIKCYFSSREIFIVEVCCIITIRTRQAPKCNVTFQVARCSTILNLCENWPVFLIVFCRCIAVTFVKKVLQSVRISPDIREVHIVMSA